MAHSRQGLALISPMDVEVAMSILPSFIFASLLGLVFLSKARAELGQRLKIGD
jgi:hypothetical protein